MNKQYQSFIILEVGFMDGRQYLCGQKTSESFHCMPPKSSVLFSLPLKLSVIGWLGFVSLASAGQFTDPDTLKTQDIQEVTVVEKMLNPEVRSSSPIQLLSAKSIQQLNVMQVSDAVKYFSGVSVRDYGGIGGMKTVSVRSLGANHTAVSYDGVTLTDCQTGQIDLSRFSLENVDMLSLSNGQGDNIFQPARSFASASVLTIKTLVPKFEENKNLNGKATLKIGSFGLLNPAFFLEKKISRKISATLDAEWLTADGNYPYKLYNGTTVSNEIRQNTDVNNLRMEAAVYGAFAEKESGYLKAYYYRSDRGLPGATILYNPEGFSHQRLFDASFFSQAHYEKDFSKLILFQANAKYNHSILRYTDPDYLNAAGQLQNSYFQNEYYASASVLYRAWENISFSASTDGFVNTMTADVQKFVSPARYSSLTSVAAKYVDNQFLAVAGLLSTSVYEHFQTTLPDNNYQRFSPFASLSYKPFAIHDFRLRAFYKNIFRLPSFNDIYYSLGGNRTLKPENADQYNVGLTYSKSTDKCLRLFSFTLDAYHNDVSDKIVAYPNKDAFFWTVLNYGKVSIDGLDLTAEGTFRLWPKINLILGTNYSYQKALIVTNPVDRDYLNQIPYTPRVSGSVKAALETPWINLSYGLLWSGHRYAVNQNYAENSLPAYSDHSISLSRNFSVGHCKLYTSAEILNIFDENYAIIKWFPMPGRSFRATVSLKF